MAEQANNSNVQQPAVKPMANLQEQTLSPTAKRRRNIKRAVAIAVAVLLVAGIVSHFVGGKKESKISFEEAKVEQASISTSVTATGTLEAVTSVSVGTQVSGIVKKLYVDYNSQVHKGQVIAELDKENLQSQLSTAQSNLQKAQADLQSSQAQLQSAQASLNYQKNNYTRYGSLYKKGLVSANDYETARLSYQQAVEQVASARETVASSRTLIATSQEQVKQAQTNLGYATITAPIDGVVISKEVEEGQTVAASFSTPELFTIAKDLKDMQVVADVDEADIGDVKEGQRVEFTVDAYPDDTFSGTVKQVRQNATTTNNVVTYEVVISARNDDLKLKPGLTANVTIYTLERNNVTSVPSKALRFTPEPQVIGKKYKISDVKAEHKVWTLSGNTFQAHAVQVGISDGTHTEIVSGITEGTTIIDDIEVAQAGKDEEESSDDNSGSPFQPKRPGKDKNKSGQSSNKGSATKQS